MIKRGLDLAFLAACLIFTACSTTATVRGLTDLPGIPAGATGAAIPISFDAGGDPVASTGGCSLVLLRAGGIKTYEIEFMPGNSVLFADLPVGAYAYKDVICGAFNWDVSFKNWPHFEVFAGTISVVGGFSLHLTDSHSLSTQVRGRQQNRDDLLRLFGRIPTDKPEKLVSAYTGKDIAAVSLNQSAQPKRWLQEPEVKPEDRSWPNFRPCLRGENDVNGLWLGSLALEADYEKGQLVSSMSGDSWNTFTEHFAKCAKEALKDFHPRTQAKLHYKIFL